MFKSWYKSKTMWGLIISLSGGLLSQIGIEITPDAKSQLATEIVNIIPEIMEFAGLAIAAYGRVKATGGIKFKGG